MTEFKLSEQITNLLSSPSLFRDWLKSFDPDDEVGIAIECENCPVARFLTKHGRTNFAVFKYNVKNKNASETILEYRGNSELEWVTSFIEKIDSTYNLLIESTSVKAKIAIQKLNEFRV